MEKKLQDTKLKLLDPQDYTNRSLKDIGNMSVETSAAVIPDSQKALRGIEIPLSIMLLLCLMELRKTYKQHCSLTQSTYDEYSNEVKRFFLRGSV